MTIAVCPVQQKSFVRPQGFRRAVSLTFDDGRPSQLDVGMPLFSTAGVRATFYVLPRSVDSRPDDWRRAAAAGHELGAHTLSHPCTGNFGFVATRALEEMTLDRMESELLTSNEAIERTVGIRPVSFAYPCGQKFVGRGTAVRSYVPLVAKHYLSGRGWMDEYFNAPDRCDLAQLGGMRMDGSRFAQIKPALEDAARSGAWLILAGHDIGAQSAGQTTVCATLKAICAYCRDHGLWLDTVAAITSHVRDARSAGLSPRPLQIPAVSTDT